jgi:transcriptional regulator with XRE-family HTH domain
MKDLGARIQELRKKAKFSQVELADKIEISKSQMIRYENKGVQPPADVLNKLADILGTSIDFLINGDTQEKAKAIIKNTTLLQQFKDIENLPDEEQLTVIKFLGAYIRDFKTKQSYAL